MHETKQSGEVLLFATIAIVALAVLGLSYLALKHRDSSVRPPTNSSVRTIQKTPTKVTPSSSGQPITGSTSNQALTSDLQNINTSLEQDNQNLTSANQAINDQQLRISD